MKTQGKLSASKLASLNYEEPKGIKLKIKTKDIADDNNNLSDEDSDMVNTYPLF